MHHNSGGIRLNTAVVHNLSLPLPFVIQQFSGIPSPKKLFGGNAAD